MFPLHPSFRRRGLTLIDVVAMVIIVGLLLILLLPALLHSRRPSRRAVCVNNMKQIGLSLHKHHDARKCFPSSSTQTLLTADLPVPGTAGSDGAGFSWLVHLLPFIEEGNKYKWIDLQAGLPYDNNPDHAMVAALPIYYFRCPGSATPDHSLAPDYLKDSQVLTSYVALGATHLASLYGEEAGAISDGEHPNGTIYPGSRTSFRDMVDGSSNTSVACETKETKYAAWFDGTTAAVVGLAEQTKPSFELKTDGEETHWVPKKGVQTSMNHGDESAKQYYLPTNRHSGQTNWVHGPSSNHPGVVVHLLGDGSVRTVSDGLDPALYMHLITRNGGEPVGDFHNQ